jgi:hypothetical protein
MPSSIYKKFYLKNMDDDELIDGSILGDDDLDEGLIGKAKKGHLDDEIDSLDELVDAELDEEEIEPEW